MEQLIQWAARYGIQRMMWRGPAWLVAIAILLYLLFFGSARAAMISTTSSASIGVLAWGSGDVVDLDAGVQVFDDQALFDGSENLDAWTRLGDLWLLSSSTDSTIAGVSYLDGDVIAWDPSTNTATLFLAEGVFGGANEDIDALHAFDDERLALSTTSGATLGGVSFASGDVVVFDMAAGITSILFDGSDWFDASENIDAISMLPDGSLLLSSSTDGMAGALSFRDGDVLRVDLADQTITTWLSESIFGGANEDIDALHQAVGTGAAPLPTSLALMGLGLLLVGRLHKRATP